MPNVRNSRSSLAARIALAAGVFCVACCTLPLLGLTLGSAAVLGLAVHTEKVAIMLAAVAAVALAVGFWRGRQAPACDVGGECSPDQAAEKPRALD